MAGELVCTWMLMTIQGVEEKERHVNVMGRVYLAWWTHLICMYLVTSPCVFNGPVWQDRSNRVVYCGKSYTIFI